MGGSGDANEGHFDLGPVVENGTVLARVKDDRRQPASWVDPASLTFGLGEGAKETLPQDVLGIPKGSQVWMIPSTQKAGVPWLGMNSQHESVAQGTKGGVDFTLVDVSGPGRVVVFTAGSFGGGVGETVFDGKGSRYTLPDNTHAHQNWVFTEPGTYTLTISMTVRPTGGELRGSGTGSTGGARSAVATTPEGAGSAPAVTVAGSAPTAPSAPATPGAPATGRRGGLTPTGAKGPNGRPLVQEVVGRTASGRPCTLDGSLARTGTAPLTPLALSGTLALVGTVAVLAARRRRARSPR